MRRPWWEKKKIFVGVEKSPGFSRLRKVSLMVLKSFTGYKPLSFSVCVWSRAQTGNLTEYIMC